MKVRGRLEQICKDWKEKKWLITFSFCEDDEVAKADYERLRGKELNIELKEYRKKRNLNANSYYWVLLSKICEATGRTAAYQHNLYLRACSYPDIDEEGNLIYAYVPDTEKGHKKVDEATEYHLLPTGSYVFKDGKCYEEHMMLRGSRSFDTSEMSHLIELVVEDCKDLDIETATPQEIHEYLERYGVDMQKRIST